MQFLTLCVSATAIVYFNPDSCFDFANFKFTIKSLKLKIIAGKFVIQIEEPCFGETGPVVVFIFSDFTVYTAPIVTVIKHSVRCL